MELEIPVAAKRGGASEIGRGRDIRLRVFDDLVDKRFSRCVGANAAAIEQDIAIGAEAASDRCQGRLISPYIKVADILAAEIENAGVAVADDVDRCDVVLVLHEGRDSFQPVMS